MIDLHGEWQMVGGAPRSTAWMTFVCYSNKVNSRPHNDDQETLVDSVALSRRRCNAAVQLHLTVCTQRNLPVPETTMFRSADIDVDWSSAAARFWKYESGQSTSSCW